MGWINIGHLLWAIIVIGLRLVVWGGILVAALAIFLIAGAIVL